MIKDFIGYGALFYPDSMGDIFLKDSFIINQHTLPILYEHKYIIGYSNKIYCDNYGLKIVFSIDENKLNNILKKEHHKPNKKKPLHNLSIGFKALDWELIVPYRYLRKVQILEISIVKNPAQKFATFWPHQSKKHKGELIYEN